MKTTIKNTIEAITEYLQNLTNNELISIHNEFCQSQNNSDNEIYNNEDDFFETYFGSKTLDAVRAVCYGDYRYTDEFVMFDGYANLQSFNSPSSYVDISDIANDILENSENYYGIELEEEETKEN